MANKVDNIEIIQGVVEHGRALGRTIGVPTANVVVHSNLHIKEGVYLSHVIIDQQRYDAVTNIGTNPSVGGNALRSESHILDFNADVYGKSIKIELLKFIREEIKFDNFDSLVLQIKEDIKSAAALHSAAKKEATEIG